LNESVYRHESRRFRFLPAYSRTLNLIELMFAKIKAAPPGQGLCASSKDCGTSSAPSQAASHRRSAETSSGTLGVSTRGENALEEAGRHPPRRDPDTVEQKAIGTRTGTESSVARACSLPTPSFPLRRG
jgi:hypothetical protein